jgi:hypothetical protein
MSVREQRIRNRAKKLDIKLTSVEWTPVGPSMEMCGPSGGWLVFLEDEYSEHNPIVAYHYRHVMQQLQDLAAERKKAA